MRHAGASDFSSPATPGQGEERHRNECHREEGRSFREASGLSQNLEPGRTLEAPGSRKMSGTILKRANPGLAVA